MKTTTSVSETSIKDQQTFQQTFSELKRSFVIHFETQVLPPFDFLMQIGDFEIT